MRGTGAREGTYRTAKYWGRAGVAVGGGGSQVGACTSIPCLRYCIYPFTARPACELCVSAGVSGLFYALFVP